MKDMNLKQIKQLATARTRTIKVLDEERAVKAYIFALTVMTGKQVEYNGIQKPELKAAFSFCNPKDKFSRRDGLNHAIDRLLNDETFIIPGGEGAKERVFEAALTVAEMMKLKWLRGVQKSDLF